MVNIEAVLGHTPRGEASDYFRVRAMSHSNEAFKDPFTDEPFYDFQIIIEKEAGKFSPGVMNYAVAVRASYPPKTKTGKKWKYRANDIIVSHSKDSLFDLTQDKKPEILAGLADAHNYRGDILIPSAKEAKILTLEHTVALFNFMDAIIPSSTISPTQLSGRRAMQETPMPKALSPARRRPRQ